ncbi:MAG: DUF1566 domain-containing protein [Deltaproteobacteria bacterium]|nr:DUF1566 domain-containing protein [Deltaproteobacteria bacterium]
MLGAAPNDSAPRATLQSALPLLPSEGAATVHLVGVGVSRLTKRPISGLCEGTITFKYRFRRVQHGDNIVGFHEALESEFTEAPTLVRKETRGAPLAAASPTPPRGSLEVTTDAFCILRVDGALEGTVEPAVLTKVNVAPGEHRVTCSSSQVSSVKASAAKKVEADQRVAVAFALQALEKATPQAPVKAASAGDTMIDRGDGVLEQVSSGLLWTQRDNGADVTWDAARRYCETLSTSGGGWRLPSSQEFQDVFDEIRLAGPSPCGDGYCNKSRLALTSWWFWIGEKRDSVLAWTYIFKQGYGYPYLYPAGASAGSRALCVRVPRAEEVDPPQARAKAAEDAAHREPAVEVKEIDRGGGVLEQVSSGLQWTQTDNGRDIGWNDAKKYCEALLLAGGKWRMPSLDELQNLYLDAVGTKAAPCGTYLCGVPKGFSLTSHWYWSAESDGPGKGRGYGFDTGFPGTGPAGYSYHSRVLCVRHP